MMTQRSVAIFDLGGVVIDWNPRYLYRKLFDGNDRAMEHFLATVCTPSWNELQDGGRTFADACASLKATHPGETELIDAWFKRYDEMLGGEIPGTIEILTEMRSRGITLYALSNWSTETFPLALSRFECLKWFQGVLLSGEVRLLKPDRRIFEVFLKTFAIDPARAIYIDDRRANVEVAASFGMYGVLFTDSHSLRAELMKEGLILG
jgi:2-haloacid dehalogenase